MASNNDNSDYNKVRTNLFNLLPEVFQSDVNKSVFENTLNRFLTKSETVRVAGLIGETNPNAIIDRQIQEPTPHRQAFQLEPILYDKIGTIEHMASWEDILVELERLGVDSDRFQEWGNVVQFNWVPPIDLDKLIHFRDYYWFDEDNPNSPQQYLTIRNTCTTANSRVSFFESLISQYGSLFTIVDTDPGTSSIMIGGDQSLLFTVGFRFFIKNSTNVDLDSTFQNVVSATFDSDIAQTILVIENTFTDPTADGDVSLDEELAGLQAEQQCKCDGSAGWDTLPWDAGDLWDYQEGCGTLSVNSTSADQWILQNKWVHKRDIANFSRAKQASLPIIEYMPNLELNEWTHTDYTWKYRASQFDTFEATTEKPPIIEMKPLDLYGSDVGANELIFDERYGDMTSTFVPGYTFLTDGGTTVYHVVRSTYVASAAGNPYRTHVELVEPVTDPELDPSYPVTSTFAIHPYFTVAGDSWKGYNQHWLFVEAVPTTAINHQPQNPFVEIDTLAPIVNDVNYQYRISAYAEEFTTTTTGVTIFELDGVTLPADSIRPLTRRSLVGFNDVRVYVNDIRQFGNYDELAEVDLPIPGVDTVYVAGIEFHTPVQSFDVVRVEVGEAAISNFSLYETPVRTIEDNTDFLASAEPILISTVEHRKAEQVKTGINQYPLFDLYTVTGESALKANHIFGFLESSDAPVNTNVGLRLVVDGDNYSFEQVLLEEDNGELFAYRNYNNLNNIHWINTITGDVWFWTGLTWSPKKDASNEYVSAIISATAPTSPEADVNEIYWYDTTADLLKQRNTTTMTWDVVATTDFETSDPTIQTIWKAGLNKEEYVPSYVDENRDPIAIGDPAGSWETPDPLYFNHMHENRVILTSQDLLAHFASIVEEQDTVPGFSGPKSDQFHLLYEDSVNFGVGGSIKEFNDGFDTLLSSTFVNNITPPTLFEFAQDQYESSLNSLIELYRRNSLEYMLETSNESLVDFYGNIATQIVDLYEQNDAANLIYGDSTTFDDTTDLGVRNWIATLPYFSIVPRQLPELSTDPSHEINTVIHHDGHRFDYELATATVESIIQRTINAPDPRTADFSGVPQETYGRSSTVEGPPDDLNEYITDFSTDIRSAVYWLYIENGRRYFYRLSAYVSVSEPSVSNPDGTLWMDLTPSLEVLRVKNGGTWDVAPGLAVGDGRLHNGTDPNDVRTATVSAWELIIIDTIVSNIILEVENQLYENAPVEFDEVFDFSTLTDTPSEEALYNELLEEQFLAFARESENPDPLSATGHYVASNPFTWNYKHSAPGTQYEIVGLSDTAESFVVEGDETAVFTPATTFYIKNAEIDNGQWTVLASVYNVGLDETIITVTGDVQGTDPIGIIYMGLLPSSANTGAESGGDWRDLYQKTYGTPYPHLEPWKLQGYTDKPSWWEGEYRNDDPVIYGARRWKYIHAITTGMWENIRIGSVPVGELLPDGLTVSTGAAGEVGVSYNYFSVNIGDFPVAGGGRIYQPDAVYPPYFDFVAAGQPLITNNRSIFSDFTIDIVAPGLDYVFGDAGPFEWEWRNASQFLYDQLIVAFKMQPTRLINQTFGTEFIDVACLQIDSRTNNTFAHNRTKFHGEILEDNTQLQVNGINQWYVNANRFAGYDSAYSDFRNLWTLWTAPLMYQFASFINEATFDIGSRVIDISPFDYDVTLKKSPGVEDAWLHSFDVSILKTAPSFQGTNTNNDWRLSINTRSPLNQPVEYYATKNFQFHVDSATDTCTLYTYPIVGIDAGNDAFEILGDQTEVFTPGRTFSVNDSTGNDGAWEVSTSAYDSTTNRTNVEVTTSITNGIVDGLITADYRTLPWETGDGVWMSTGGILPIPLRDDIIYYIIKLNDNQFQLALRQSEALDGFEMDLATGGQGDQYVGEITSTFTALNGQTTNQVWNNYAVDKTLIKTFTPPYAFNGIQHLVDIVRGYDILTSDRGFKVNMDSSSHDPDTGRIVGWQLEVERFIDFAFQRRRENARVEDRYEVTVDDSTNVWSFVTTQPQFITGDAISVTAVGLVPSPLTKGLTYYMIRDSFNEFRVAATKRDAEQGVEVDILPTVHGTPLYITQANVGVSFPTQEINPFRLGIWFTPERGIISNLVTGPYVDIRTEQLLFDQYSRRLSTDIVNILREDKVTRIRVADEVDNDVELTRIFEDPYNYLHMAGCHLFLDTYEHVLRFNNETTEGALIYDPFIGLNISKFDVNFNRQVEFTQRPNVGGFYLLNNDLFRNIEAQVSDMREYYDTFVVEEQLETTKHGRAALGYEGTKEYLDNLNVNPKSQFIFWRGMIQNKGSINAVKAFINSRRFVDAKIDEYWALKIAEFGSVGEKEYPEMFVTTEDARLNEFRMEFKRQDESCAAVDSTFTCITLNDEARWKEWPDQLATLSDNGNGLYFDMTTDDSLEVALPHASSYIEHNFNSDGIVATFKMYPLGERTQNASFTGTSFPVLSYVPGTEMLVVYVNGVKQDLGTDYTENAGSPFYSTGITFLTPLGAANVEVVYVGGTLLDPDHYTQFNSKIVELDTDTDLSLMTELTLWSLIEHKQAQNPAKIRDVKAEVVISTVPIWNPARGFHFQNAISIINLYNDVDQAIYTDTLRTQVIGASPPIQVNPWALPEVGTVWQDTTNLDYKPYYDDKVFPNVETRSNRWGELSDWGEVRIYEWTQSDVPPSEYDEVAATEENDSTIDESVRKSGTVKKVWIDTTGNTLIENIYDEFSVVLDGSLTGPGTYDFTLTNVSAGDIVNVYINGAIAVEGATATNPMSVSSLAPVDTVRIVYTVAEQVAALNVTPDTAIEDIEYVEIVTNNENDPTATISTYYFWVENKTTRQEGQLVSLREATRQMVDVPSPYIFFQKPVDASDGLPARYVQAIVRGLRGVVNDENRYTLRFTRDFTLRDSLEYGTTPLELKNLHAEWELFREKQPYHIKRSLWDLCTEAMVGYKLANPSTRVPSLERELYDAQYGTDTQYGLGEDQAFANGTTALETVILDLESPDNDFSPVDINAFFVNNSFDTPENIITSMDTIYNTFKFEDVNRIYFEILDDSLTVKGKYPELFKTSWLSLHGIKILEVGGLFDD